MQALSRVGKVSTMKNGIVWYKLNDLRVCDHLPLYQSHNECNNVNHIFTYDPRLFETTDRGIDKMCKKRFKFLYDSVNDLKQVLKENGSKLHVFYGTPEEILPHVTSKWCTDIIYSHDEYVQEEKSVLNHCKQIIDRDISFQLYWGGGTLLQYPNDVPFDIEDLGYFTSFRNIIESSDILEGISCLPKPLVFQPFQDIEIDQLQHHNDDSMILTWSKLTNEPIVELSEEEFNQPNDDAKAFTLKGGESQALLRIDYYISNGHIEGRLRDYKSLRNGLIGMDYSSKLSPYLAHGCISSRQVYKAVKDFEEKSGIADENTYWLIFELLWRDYMHLYGLKLKNKMFHLGGIDNRIKADWTINPAYISAWMEGRTGYPFIDANMRQLAETGYMSNRGRQIVASFFTRDLSQDWRYGAEYFESILLDYDVCSNWGNWQYASGVGPDPREDRYFNVIKQATVYDPDCDFIRLWIPELSVLSNEVLHNIGLLTEDLRITHGISDSIYPRPIASLIHSSFKPESKKKLKQRLKSGGIPKSRNG